MQQVNLLLLSLPYFWNTFVTTQGGIANLTFTKLLSNILQHVINISKIESQKSNAFYVKGKFQKPTYNNSQQRFLKSPTLSFNTPS